MNILSTQSNDDCLSPLHVLISTVVSYIACNIALYVLSVPLITYIVVLIAYIVVYYCLMKINTHSFKE